MDVHGVSLFTAISTDVQSVSISSFHNQQNGRAGCIPFHNQQNGRAGCIPFHNQQNGRAGCIPFHSQQYGRSGSPPSAASCIDVQMHFHSQQYGRAGRVERPDPKGLLTLVSDYSHILFQHQYGSAGCVPFNSQLNGCADCNHFYGQEYDRAVCTVQGVRLSTASSIDVQVYPFFKCRTSGQSSTGMNKNAKGGTSSVPE